MKTLFEMFIFHLPESFIKIIEWPADSLHKVVIQFLSSFQLCINHFANKICRVGVIK